MYIIHPAEMGVRIILLGILGLGALYMIHLLAQDYNKIRQPIAKAAKSLFRFKRDLNITVNNKNNDTMSKTDEKIYIDWEKILRYDPLNCALLLICEISAGAEKENKEAGDILELIKFSVNNKAPSKVIKSFSLGEKYKNEYNKCFTNYPVCPYSAKTMLKLLEVYSFFVN